MFPIRTSIAIHETPGVVVGLILANVVVFLLQQSLPPDLAHEFILRNALVPANYSTGITLGALAALITNAFMHVGWWHLLLNMWVLWVFGRPLEQRLGVLRFVLLYLASGIIASLAHLFANLGSPIPALGASGAIAGVLGAYTLLHPRSRIVFFGLFIHELPAVLFTVLWFAIQVVQGVTDLLNTAPGTDGIAWWAHIGGFAGGLVLVNLLGRPRPPRRVTGMTERTGELEIGPPVANGRVIGPIRPRQLVPVPIARSRTLAGRPPRNRGAAGAVGGRASPALDPGQPVREGGKQGIAFRAGKLAGQIMHGTKSGRARDDEQEKILREIWDR
ncbi:MAG: rhomboid family intramembrane serine protease [Proteobacteria bacterium]|nr:rhomboid family intramembrane serine protease [Pseudomonadota bacterium]